MKTDKENFDEWMIDYMAGCLSDENLQKFHALLQSDVLFQKRFKELAQEHARLLAPRFARIQADNYETLLRRLNRKEEAPARPMGRFPWKNLRRIAAAAALLVASALAGYYLWNDLHETARPPVFCRVEVPLGAAQTRTVLPDGTAVYLNSGSVLKYDTAFMQPAEREVYLTGEACFEVRKDAGKPFIVHTEKLNIKVLGTVFNVRAYPDEPNIEVALVEGKVNVFSRSETEGNIVLHPDRQAVYERRTGKLFSEAVDAEAATRWTTGRLSFVDASLPDILKEIERKYDVRIVIGSERMKSEIFSGSIGPEFTLDELLDYLDVDDKYRWTQEGNVITITDK